MKYLSVPSHKLWFFRKVNYEMPKGAPLGLSALLVCTAANAEERNTMHRIFICDDEPKILSDISVKLLACDTAELIGGDVTPIGRSYAETAKKQLMRYMLK